MKSSVIVAILLTLVLLGTLSFYKYSTKKTVSLPQFLLLEEKSDKGEGNIIFSAKGVIDKDATVFEIAMNTHEVDLTGFRVEENTTLVIGDQVFEPISWEEKPGSTHHRSGKLSFKRINQLQKILLVINNLGGVSARTIEWTI